MGFSTLAAGTLIMQDRKTCLSVVPAAYSSEYGHDPKSPTGKVRLISDAAKSELATLKPEMEEQK